MGEEQTAPRDAIRPITALYVGRLSALAEGGVTDLNLGPSGAVRPAGTARIERLVERASAL
jgi:hypothetical protein